MDKHKVINSKAEQIIEGLSKETGVDISSVRRVLTRLNLVEALKYRLFMEDAAIKHGVRHVILIKFDDVDHTNTIIAADDKYGF